MNKTKEIIKGRLDMEGMATKGPWIGFFDTVQQGLSAGETPFRICVLPQSEYIKHDAVFIYKSRNEYRPTNEVVLLLLEALEFYGNGKNWDGCYLEVDEIVKQIGEDPEQYACSVDGYDPARQALKKIQEMIK